MPSIAAYPTDWTVNQVLTESALEAQFNHIRDGVNASCVFKDVASQTVSVGVTFTATQTYTPGSGVGISVTTGGVTIVGNSTITGTLGGVTTLSCTTVTATNLGGTLTTASQPNITTLAGLTTATITTLTATTINQSGAYTTTYPLASGAAIYFNPSSTDALVTIKDTAKVSVKNNAATRTILVLDATGAACKIGLTSDILLADTGGGKATNSTAGFPVIPSMNGIPSGTPTSGVGCLVHDAVNGRLYVYNGAAWQYAALT